jgi:hypothetical protein
LAEGSTNGGRWHWRNISVFTSGNKVMSELRRCCHHFLQILLCTMGFEMKGSLQNYFHYVYRLS